MLNFVNEGENMRLIVGISGASGIIIAVELLRKLKCFEDVETGSPSII